ncbi:hypothetical protein C7212DRAFT_347912 [Tuber magnatum]|uniref:Uncharacterized protein n=1 Tax=Tuber magnatum TaxID=42249 RepID=A0A317SDH9_9PEZI|nr:hypothetical protein C7212DRAFT_347912 [Tuber magnatum]
MPHPPYQIATPNKMCSTTGGTHSRARGGVNKRRCNHQISRQLGSGIGARNRRRRSGGGTSRFTTPPHRQKPRVQPHRAQDPASRKRRMPPKATALPRRHPPPPSPSKEGATHCYFPQMRVRKKPATRNHKTPESSHSRAPCSMGEKSIATHKLGKPEQNPIPHSDELHVTTSRLSTTSKAMKTCETSCKECISIIEKHTLGWSYVQIGEAFGMSKSIASQIAQKTEKTFQARPIPTSTYVPE